MDDSQSKPKTDLCTEKEKEFQQFSFKELNCDQQKLSSKVFDHCTFTKCSFRETVFKSCKFRDCTFIHCDFSLAKVPGSLFQNTKFKASQLIGINWAAANWPKVVFLKPFEFCECVLNYSTFIDLNLRGIVLRKCVAKDVDFSDADLSQADLRDTDFTQSRFIQTDLTEADFTHAENYQINPDLVTLKGTKFSLPEAMALLYGLDIVLTD